MTAVLAGPSKAGLRARRTLNIVLTVLGALGLAAALPGLAADKFFDLPTTIKYSITVIAPLLMLAVARLPSPQRLLVPLAILSAPIAGLVMTVHGITVSLLTVTLLLAVASVAFSQQLVVSRSGAAVGAILALLLPAVVLGTGQQRQITMFIDMVVIAAVTARLVRQPGGLQLAVAAMLGSSAVQGIAAIYEFVTGREIDLYAASNPDIASKYFFNFGGVNRPSGTFSDPNSLGNVLAVTVPIGVAALVHLLRRREWGAASLTGVALLLTLIGLSLTLSRQSWIGAMVGALVVTLGFRRPWRTRALLAIVASGAAAVYVVLQVVGGGALGSRFSSILNPTSNAASAGEDRQRVQLWSIAYHVFEHNWLSGVGFGRLNPLLTSGFSNTDATSSAQNVFLQIASEAGILGLVAIVLLGLVLSRDLITSTADLGWRWGFGGALVALVIVSLTDNTVLAMPVAATIAPVFGMIAGIARSPQLKTSASRVVPQVV